MADPSTRVIKAGRPDGARSEGSPEELLATARARGRELVAAAEAEAEELRTRARQEALQGRLAAIAEGHAEGLARAAAELARVAQVREEKLAALDGAVVEVALEIARRVVGRELLTQPDAVLDVARRALRAAAGTGDVVIRVAPCDLPAVSGTSSELAPLLGRGALTIAEDPALQRGEVVVETGVGRIDARVGAQLDAFRRALRVEAG